MAPGRPSTCRKGLLRRTFTYLSVLIGLLALVEGTLRFGLGLGNPVLYVPDSACNYILKPNQNVVRFFARTSIDRNGMRSDAVPANRAPHTLRLMFVGDSITYGTGRIDQSRIFSELLRHDLPSNVHEPVEVLNASARGWAIDNELSYVRSRGIFQSDVVLLVLNSGDLTQTRSTIVEVGDALPEKQGATAVGELWTRYIEPRLFHLRAHADAGDTARDNADDVVRANLENLEAFHALVASQHARLLIVYAPFRKDIPAASARSAATLHTWTAQHQVPLLDLTAAEAAYSAREITLDGGVHFNDKGHRVVAEAIERAWPSLAQTQ